MNNPKIIIDVRGMPDMAKRPKKVSKELDTIKSGDNAEIIADDEKMLELAPKMIKSIGKANLLKTWKGEDGFYHSLVQKL